MVRSKKKYCVCCKKELIQYSNNQKYCSSCSLYTKKQRMRTQQLKADLKRIRNKYYNLKDKDNLGIKLKQLEVLKEIVARNLTRFDIEDIKIMDKYFIIKLNDEVEENA